jgi:hypothetical protein
MAFIPSMKKSGAAGQGSEIRSISDIALDSFRV